MVKEEIGFTELFIDNFMKLKDCNHFKIICLFLNLIKIQISHTFQ